jgi:hypothetical protein
MANGLGESGLDCHIEFRHLASPSEKSLNAYLSRCRSHFDR